MCVRDGYRSPDCLGPGSCFGLGLVYTLGNEGGANYLREVCGPGTECMVGAWQLPWQAARGGD